MHHKLIMATTMACLAAMPVDLNDIGYNERKRSGKPLKREPAPATIRKAKSANLKRLLAKAKR